MMKSENIFSALIFIIAQNKIQLKIKASLKKLQISHMAIAQKETFTLFFTETTTSFRHAARLELKLTLS